MPHDPDAAGLAERALPEVAALRPLVRQFEVRLALGLSEQQFARLKRDPDFPQHIIVAGLRVYDLAEVAAWQQRLIASQREVA